MFLIFVSLTFSSLVLLKFVNIFNVYRRSAMLTLTTFSFSLQAESCMNDQWRSKVV